ncbi:hypothetical protein IX51_06600 [uncultured archaeon]|nr:hypothetical protein IX51_06600 [uncultured archaeon]
METPYSNLKVWFDGKTMGFDEATVPVTVHSLQYGSGIFEGIRAYKTEKGPAIFRLKEHVRRFFDTAKIYGMDLGYTPEQINNAIVETVKMNSLDSCYIRPFAFYNDVRIGLSTEGKKISVYIAAIPLGSYFGETQEKGAKCKTSSWRRINSDIIPVRAKASGNYLNSILTSREVKNAGFDEAILLSGNGYLAEGPGENIFIARDGKLFTPGTSADILVGITRDTIIEIAGDKGIEVVERDIHREEIYVADEAFFCGTAAEVTPIASVDGIKVGSGKRGPITSSIAQIYFDTVAGKVSKYEKWLTYVK